MATIRNRDGRVLFDEPGKSVRQLVRKYKDGMSEADLAGVDLSGLDLSGADLSFARLDGADLSGARLGHANLSFASLWKACLDDADMTDADLYHAGLEHASLLHTDLRGADLTGAQVDDTTFSNADLAGADLTGVCMRRADFTYADMTDAILPTRFIFAQAHAMSPDAGLDEDISLDWSAAGRYDDESLLDHIREAWLCMDGIWAQVGDDRFRAIGSDQALTDPYADALYVAPRYPRYTLNIPRDPTANMARRRVGIVEVTVDGWDLAQAVTDHVPGSRYVTPPIASSVADLRPDAIHTLAGHGLAFLDADGLDGFIRDMTDRRGGGLCWNAEYCDADMTPTGAIYQAAKDNGAVDITLETALNVWAATRPAAGTATPGMEI